MKKIYIIVIIMVGVVIVMFMSVVDDMSIYVIFFDVE